MTLGTGECLTIPETTYRRRMHKWAMVGYKGGCCERCGERVTQSNIEEFECDHKIPVNNSRDSSDRWAGAICWWAPFTEKWFLWCSTINLVCKRCHFKKRGVTRRQLEIDWAAQARIDSSDQSIPSHQLEMV